VAASPGAPRWPSASGSRPERSALRREWPTPGVRSSRVRWIHAGDLNGFLGLALDNVTQLVVLSSLLIGVFKFPSDLVLQRMVPGTALGVLLGNLAYTWLAVKLMRRTGRADVTAMPFGIDTPTLFAMVFGVLGPVMVATGDPVLAWKVGMAATIAIGCVKLGLALAGDWARRVVPRAALLGSIAGVSILLIAFLPMLKILRDPPVGLVALLVLLLALFGRVRMPFGLPGAFVSVLAGALIFWGRAWLELGPGAAIAVPPVTLSLPWPTLAWLDALAATLPYLSVALPFALVTTIGGIDNTESAAAAGDEYRARDVLLTEAAATIAAGACGGVIQNTPYIGHPAYKSMGAHAGYTLATGLVIGVGAATGALSLLVAALPEAAIAPILVFIGLEITAQGFLATPPRYGAAVALTFVPVAAAVVLIQSGGLLSALGVSPAALTGEAAGGYQALLVLGNGFILIAVLWGWALAAIIDRRLALAGVLFAVAAAATLFGVIHSPTPRGALFWPWAAPSSTPGQVAGAYAALAALCWLARRARTE
jgi:AGZA family xanthine/uracil permease-like MFS transporter